MLTYQVLWNSLDTIIEFWKTDWVMLLSTIYAAVAYDTYCNYFSKKKEEKQEEEKQEKVTKDPVHALCYVISIVIFYKFFSLDWNQIAEVRSSSDLSAILITVLFAAFAYEAWKLNRKTLDEEIEKAEKRIKETMDEEIKKAKAELRVEMTELHKSHTINTHNLWRSLYNNMSINSRVLDKDDSNDEKWGDKS